MKSFLYIQLISHKLIYLELLRKGRWMGLVLNGPVLCRCLIFSYLCRFFLTQKLCVFEREENQKTSLFVPRYFVLLKTYLMKIKRYYDLF